MPGDLGFDDTLQGTVTSPSRKQARLRAGLRPTDPVLVGRYRIVRRLGEGGMGMVYAAFDPELGREVAVKVVHPHRDADERARERLLREARAMARLSQPNVVDVYDAGRCGDGVFIAMELVAGQSLARWLAGKPPWTDVVDVFAAAGLGLAAAHEAGIIHRDFKPANVMVGDDKTVRVLDFGLARAEGPVATVPFSLPPALDRKSLTCTGSVVGTPAYMAPEQIAGGTLDARTDQFSFCVALYEALWGTRPWNGDTWPQLATQILNADVPTPPRSRVPEQLASIVRRGLARRPEDRHPDMQSLVNALRSVPRRRRMPWLAAGGLALAAAVVVVAWPRAASEPCDPQPRVSAVWNASTRDAVARRFEADDAALVAEIHTRVEGGLDDFASRWSTTYRELCTTTDDPQLLDERMRCLDGRLSAFEAVVGVLAEREGDTLRRADAIVDGLPEIDACRDVETMRAPVSASMVAAVALVERDVARVDALVDAGRAADALDLASATVADAERLGLDAAITKAQTAYGTALRNLGRFAEARDAYERAFVTAIAAHDDDQAFALASVLVFVHGVNLEDAAEAQRWIEQAESLLERRSFGARALARFHNDVGSARAAAGDFEEARERHRRALGLLEAESGRVDLSVAHTLDMLASVSNGLGRYEEAEKLARQGIAIRSARLGERHPSVADSLNDLGNDLTKQRKYAEAEAALRRSHEILAEAYGEDNNRAIVPLSNLGVLLSSVGRYAEAQAVLERVLEVQERDLGDDHRETMVTLSALAIVHQRLGHRDDAERLLLRALSSIERTRGPDHADAAVVLNSLGAIYGKAGEDARALEMFEQALTIRQRTLPAEHPWIASTHYNVAALLYNMRRADESLAHFEESLRIGRADPQADAAEIAADQIAFASALRSAGHIDRAIEELRQALPVVEREAANDPRFARHLADGRFTLARALAASDPHSKEAIELATAARDYYQEHTEQARDHLEPIQNWLANPRLRDGSIPP